MASTYEVSGPLVVAAHSDNKVHYYYQGAILPPELPQSEVDRLVAVGLVREVTKATVTEAPLDLNGGVVQGPVIGGAAPSAPVERPADTDSTKVWQAYAVSQGMTEDEAKKLNRGQLIERYPAAGGGPATTPPPA
jgi:hypothetical protein